ncbi:MAG TPA: hypothetical protein VGL51_19150 [Solirubrobacteraceae bacterium]|jgi:hypothetical protein
MDDESAPDEQRPGETGEAPEDQPKEPGAEGGSQSPAADKLPAAPADDDSDVGDTDQHSSA